MYGVSTIGNDVTIMPSIGHIGVLLLLLIGGTIVLIVLYGSLIHGQAATVVNEEEEPLLWIETAYLEYDSCVPVMTSKYAVPCS